MNPYTKICLVAGLCTTTYLILKFIKTNLEQEPKKKTESEKVEVKGENVTQSSSSAENKLKKKSVSFSVEKSGESKRKRIKKESEENTETMKIVKQKPNFFIAVQVFNREIHENVKKFQERIIEKNPLLYTALIPVSTLHLTLAVTHLANETEIKTLKGKLKEWTDKNIKSLMKEPIMLNFNGVNTFNDMVAYVALDKDQNYQKLSELAQAMDDVLSSAGLTNDSKRFTPHLTILKLSKDHNLLKSRKGFKKDFGWMRKCKDYFGNQEVKNIQLLSMNEPKDKHGYYKSFHQIKISDPEVETDHSMCCSPIPDPKLIKGETENK